MGCILSICKPSRIDVSSAETTINERRRAEENSGDDLCGSVGSESCGMVMMRDERGTTNSSQALPETKRKGSILTMLFNKKRAVSSNESKQKQQHQFGSKKFRPNRKVSVSKDETNQVEVMTHINTSIDEVKRKHSKMQNKRSACEQSEGEILGSDHQSSIVRENVQSETDEVNLFTSVQQLCSDIISSKLLNKLGCNVDDDIGKVLCLFAFGCQGSNKGEISFELVEHSSIYKLLESQSNFISDRLNCPLYHHIDVSTLIIANIDERIREYNHLAAQSLILKQEQHLRLFTISCSDENINSQPAEVEEETRDGDQQSVNNDVSLDQSTTLTETDRDQSISSDLSPSTSMLDLNKQHFHQNNDDFSLITLSTKQRSILQLKLMKYFNSITSKWIFELIQHEVDKLESKIKEKYSINRGSAKSTPTTNCSRVPDRVYLIDLVPNQLSLFKSCLYLHQDIFIKESFKYPYYAIKFERRTNIKLLTKEHAANKDSLNKSSSSLRIPNIRIANLRLPLMLNMKQAVACDSMDTSWSKNSLQSNCKTNDGNSNKANLALMATDVLADGLSEKLGPKFNDNFVGKFKSMKKLIQVRYNQTDDFNHLTSSDNYCCYLRLNNYEDQTFRCWSAQPNFINEINPDDANSLKQTNRQLSASMQNLQNTHDESSTDILVAESQKSHHRLSVSSAQDGLMNRSDHHLSLADQQHVSYFSSNSSTLSNSACDDLTKQENQTIGTIQHLKMRGISIPCAVEIELFDCSCPQSKKTSQQHIEQAGKGTKWHHLRPYGSPNEQSSSSEKNQPDNLDKLDNQLSLAPLAVFQDPNKNTARSSSRSSSIIFTRSQPQKQLISPPPTQLQQSESNSPRSSSTPSPSIQLSPHDCYQLVPVRVAYANNQSQLMLEAKRVYSHQLKLKSSGDLARLIKYINKAKMQLKLDCESWLMEAISSRNRTYNHTSEAIPSRSGQHSPSSLSPTKLGSHRRPHPLVTGGGAINPHHHHLHLYDDLSEIYKDSNQMPALIVCTIRIDISRIKSGNFQYPSNFHPDVEKFLATDTIIDDEQRVSQQRTTNLFHHNSKSNNKDKSQQLVPILKLNDNVEAGQEFFASSRPLSARSLNNGHPITTSGTRGQEIEREQELKVRPASSRPSCDRQIHHRPKRHVQFKLSSQAAQSGRTVTKWNDRFGSIQAQHRKWIDSQLFVSLTSNKVDEDSLKNLRLVTLVGDLIRAHISSDGARSCANEN